VRLTKNSIPKPQWKKGMEKRARTIFGLKIPTPITLPSSAGNYLQVPCTCFDLRAASHLVSRVNVAKVLVIDTCCNIFKLSHEHRAMMMYWFSSAARCLLQHLQTLSRAPDNDDVLVL
jgi:hypothetical protein